MDDDFASFEREPEMPSVGNYSSFSSDRDLG
jgi:hypothetical protein